MKDFSEIRQSEEVLEEGLQDPPMIVVLRRTAIRLFPGNQRVALYTNDKLGIEVSVPYEAGQIGGKKLTAVMKEETSAHAKATRWFGDYLTHTVGGHKDKAAKMREDITRRHGLTVASHLHNAATAYRDGNFKQADAAFGHLTRAMSEEVKLPQLMEGAIHKLHHIATTKTDGDVIFKNGATARVSAQQALAVVKLHKALTPENKVKLENQVNGSPEDMRAVIEFSNENLK